VNIITQTAQAMFSVRALNADYLPVVSKRVVECAEAVALVTGTQVEIQVQRGYKDMHDNMTMVICDIGESMCHQDTFVECADRPRGYATMVNAAKAMALTAYALLI
jgi:metal-dependent amidase/aminoacylase/carboxypeptidase family protein